ncbi:dihydroxy-acid dehydratase [Roseivivax marinus]|uniref:dihydroxy-acid dehydratase n=1 Tax=Roseivivax marinus TaxID=1379903 RepID=UPI00273F6903|nr:dihydroxy-acid dehydratase [Roseivivax marinus]
MGIARALLGLGLIAALAGCEMDANGQARGFLSGFESPGTSGGRDALSKPGDGPPPVPRAAVAGGAVVVAGPRGYCVDPVTVESDDDTGFAVLASCRILGGPGAGPNVAPALVTVTVGAPEPAPVLPTAETFARLSGGAARPGRSGGDLVVAQMQTGGERVLPNGDPRYWRGAFLVANRLVSLALYAPEGSSLAGDDGGQFLGSVRRAIRAGSPAGGALTGRPASGPSGG